MDEATKALCNEKHEQIEKTLDNHRESIRDHYERIGRLEVAQGIQIEKIDNVCSKVGNLTKAIWWAIGAFITAWIAQNIDKILPM